MSVTCPICNESLSPGMARCPRCGFTLAGATEAFQPVPAEQAAAAESVPVLKVVKGPYTGQEFSMREGSFTIGRDPSCDLFLNNMTVSRLHATITITGESASIVDEGSLNGTWVNGAVVDQAPLTSGSTVQIGTFEMVFQRKRV